MKAMRGQTLLELVVCLFITGIFLGMAAPSFIEMLQVSRKTQAVNQLLGELHHARIVAVQERTTIGICSGRNVCDGARTWRGNLLVFRDSNRNGAIEAGERLIRQLELPDETAWRWSRFGQQAHLHFEANGTTRAANGTLTLCMNNQPQHQLVISLSGRIRSQKAAASATCK